MSRSLLINSLLVGFMLLLSYSTSWANILSLEQFHQAKSSLKECTPSEDSGRSLTIRFRPASTNAELNIEFPTSSNDQGLGILKVTNSETNEKIQTLELEGSLDYDINSLCFITIDDFNFDGYLDLAVRRSTGVHRENFLPHQFWLFDSKKMRFQTTSLAKALAQLDDLLMGVMSFDQKQKRIMISRTKSGLVSVVTYKIVDDTLLLDQPMSSHRAERAILDKLSVTSLKEPIPLSTGLWKAELLFSEGIELDQDDNFTELCTNFTDWRKEVISEFQNNNCIGEEDCDGVKTVCNDTLLQQRAKKEDKYWQLGAKQLCKSSDGSQAIFEYWLTPLSPKNQPLNRYEWEMVVSTINKKGKIKKDISRGRKTWLEEKKCE